MPLLMGSKGVKGHRAVSIKAPNWPWVPTSRRVSNKRPARVYNDVCHHDPPQLSCLNYRLEMAESFIRKKLVKGRYTCTAEYCASQTKTCGPVQTGSPQDGQWEHLRCTVCILCAAAEIGEKRNDTHFSGSAPSVSGGDLRRL